MNYYIFRVQDSLSQEYYLVCSKYIGYLDFDSNWFRSLLEYNAKIKRKYQLFAESIELMNGSLLERKLHQLFCDSTRLTKEEAIELVEENHQLYFVEEDTWYKMYFPNRNSSEQYLKEIDGNKTIGD